jgi:hypothetical protein
MNLDSAKGKMRQAQAGATPICSRTLYRLSDTRPLSRLRPILAPYARPAPRIYFYLTLAGHSNADILLTHRKDSVPSKTSNAMRKAAESGWLNPTNARVA